MKKRKSKMLPNGKSASKEKGVWLREYMLNSEAWKSLNCASRVLYIELRRRYNGSNNGKIGMSYKCITKALKCSASTAGKCLNELMVKGFIKRTYRGMFTVREKASEWALMEELLNDKPATKEFMRWRKGISFMDSENSVKNAR